MLYTNSYLGLSKVAQSEVKSPQVVEDLRGNVSLHLLLQDAGGCAVRRQCSLNVSLLQDLSQLDPRLHIIWVLLGHLLQMTLRKKDSELIPDTYLRYECSQISKGLNKTYDYNCDKKKIISARYILWQCLSFPDRQMLHRETPEFS